MKKRVPFLFIFYLPASFQIQELLSGNKRKENIFVTLQCDEFHCGLAQWEWYQTYLIYERSYFEIGIL